MKKVTWSIFNKQIQIMLVKYDYLSGVPTFSVLENSGFLRKGYCLRSKSIHFSNDSQSAQSQFPNEKIQTGRMNEENQLMACCIQEICLI